MKTIMLFYADSFCLTSVKAFLKMHCKNTWLIAWVLVRTAKQGRTKFTVYSNFIDLYEVWPSGKLSPGEETNFAECSSHSLLISSLQSAPGPLCTSRLFPKGCPFCFLWLFGTPVCQVQKLGFVSASVPGDHEVICAPFCWLIEAADLRVWVSLMI